MIVIVGESASGKSTVEKILNEKYGMRKVVSYTTRPPRDTEVNGVDYNFISMNDFLDLDKEKALNICLYGLNKKDGYKGIKYAYKSFLKKVDKKYLLYE